MTADTGSERGLRLGELLVAFEFATENDLREMLSIANETSMPVGRVFVLTGMIQENDLHNLIQCQSFLKEKILDLNRAKQAMHFARDKRVLLEQALAHFGWAQSDTLHETTPLGELLIDSDYISRSQLESSLLQHKKSGLPFGRTLVLAGAISEALLSAAVNAQIMIRDKKISRQQAVEALKEARKRQVSFETSLKVKGFYDLPKRSAPRIGELLTFAGIISDGELASALEAGLISKLPVGEVLVQSRLLKRNMLDAALAAQKLLADGSISFNEVRTLLDDVKDGKTFESAREALKKNGVKPTKPQPQSLYAFLKMLRCLTDDDLSQAFETAKDNTQVLSQVLLIGGTMDENTLHKADECRMLVHEGRLSIEHATIAFDYSQRRSISIPEAMKELQWHESADMKKISAAIEAPKQIIQAVDSENIDLGSLRGMALQLTAQGSYSEARERWVTIISHLVQPYDSRYCECLEGIAEAYTLEQDFANAQQYHQAALTARLNMHGADSLSAAFAMSNMGRVAYLQRNFEVAEHYGREHIRIIAQNMGAEHPDVACGYQNLANVYHMQNKNAEAEHAYRLAVKICNDKLGETHPATIRLSRDYASLLQKMDRMAEAQKIDPLANGRITGSWRALQVLEDDKLHAET